MHSRHSLDIPPTAYLFDTGRQKGHWSRTCEPGYGKRRSVVAGWAADSGSTTTHEPASPATAIKMPMAARTSRRMHAVTLLLLLAPLAARAQLSSLPDLNTATETSTSAQTTGQATQTGGGTQTQGGNTDQTSSTQKAGTLVTNAPDLTSTSDSTADLRTALTGTYTESNFGIITGNDGPTIAGVGIPTIVVPWTAGAPYMQKSSLPEGTFFIAVGAVLAFFGACILLWRGMVAWSINRSVKRTALASMQLNEKQPRSGLNWRSSSGNNGYNRVSTGGKGSLYKDAGAMSTVSLDNLTAAGKHKPQNLFFSPTMQAAQNRDSVHRNSGYMPSGYYASPAASQAAGGMPMTTVGGLAPGHGHSNRYSAMSGQSGYSPPSSPGLPPQSRGSTIAPRDTRSRDGLRAPQGRDGYSSNRNSAYLHGQPSTSSLMVGSNSVSDLAPSRAPSAYLEELMDNHGNGPRERF